MKLEFVRECMSEIWSKLNDANNRSRVIAPVNATLCLLWAVGICSRRPTPKMRPITPSFMIEPTSADQVDNKPQSHPAPVLARSG